MGALFGGIARFVAAVWPWLTFLWPLSKCKMFSTTRIWHYEGGHHTGYKTTFRENLSGEIIAETHRTYSTGGDYKQRTYTDAGIWVYAVGIGGLYAAIFTFLSPYLVDIACLCSLGFIDLRDDPTGVAYCICGISIVAMLLARAMAE